LHNTMFKKSNPSKEHVMLFKLKFKFFLFRGTIFSAWIRNRIPDPDHQLNPDPIWIWNTGSWQCCGSEMFIPDPGSNFFSFRIPDPNFFSLDPGSASKNLSSSRIRILTFYLSRILDPGVKQAPDPGSGSAAQVAEYS
jgi:hypothetical protein